MEKIIAMIVERLVTKPEAVSVTLGKREDKEVYQVKVAKDDLGKVIGKHGKNAVALRTLVLAITTKDGKPTGLDIIDDEKAADTAQPNKNG
jgi:predicted RNA-binding protein YlqC (UPF0109 family)